MRDLPTVSVMILLLATPAAAQTGNPGGAEPGTLQPRSGGPSTAQPNDTDRLFAHLIAVGGVAEIEAGRMAQDKAHAGAVKDFAQRMVQDHTKANDELASWAKSTDIRLPSELDDTHKAVQAGLRQAHGAGFDHAYMRGQIEDHQKAVQLLEWEIGSGQNAKLQKLAAQVLPTVLEHLEMAQSVLTDLTGQAPTSADDAATGSVPAPSKSAPVRSR